MLSCRKSKRIVCLVCVIVMILGGCSLKEKPKPTNQQEQAETTNVPLSFTLIISEADDCRVLNLTAIEETPDGLLQGENKYLFSQGTKNGNDVMFSCEGMTGNGKLKYTLLLSLCDSDSKYLCTYKFQNVSLRNNAHIDLSNVLHGKIAVSANHEENTYSGYISVIS